MSDRLLDVRTWPVPQRQTRILSAFNALAAGKALKVLIDYEPLSLHWRFDEKCMHRFTWRQRPLGEELWEVTIGRIPRAGLHSIDSFLEECEALATVRAKTRKALAAYAISRTIEANEVVAEQNSRWPYLGFLRKGYLFASLTTPTGRDQLIFDVLPRQTFGEVNVLDEGSVVARYVAAGTPAEILIIPRHVVKSLAGRDAGLALGLASACAQRLRSVGGRLYAQISQPTIARLASVIATFSSPLPGLTQAYGPLHTMTQAELAAAAGTVKIVANRDLARIEEAGAIERRRGRIVRVNREKLLRFLSTEQSSS